jgi:hypothetical protein
VEPDPDPRIHATDSNPDPDADPDPAIFFIDLQDASKKKQIKKKFFCLLRYFLKVNLHHFS